MKIDRCPHCQSKEGFYQLVKESFNKYWDGYSGIQDEYKGDSDFKCGSFKCQTCDKTIPKRLIDPEWITVTTKRDNL